MQLRLSPEYEAHNTVGSQTARDTRVVSAVPRGRGRHLAATRVVAKDLRTGQHGDVLA